MPSVNTKLSTQIDARRSLQCKHPHAQYTPLRFLHCYRCGTVLVNGELQFIDIKTEQDDTEDGITRCSSYMTA